MKINWEKMIILISTEEGKRFSYKTMKMLIITGMAGALLTMLSDVILLGRPVSAYTYFKLGTETMAGIAGWRITAGTFAGVIVLPFQLAGVLGVYYLLRPSGKALSAAVSIFLAHALSMGVAFHASYAFIAEGWKLNYEAGFMSNPRVFSMLERFDLYWKIIIGIMFVDVCIGALLYIRAVRRVKPHNKKLDILINPLSVFIAVLLVILFIPAPVGGYIAPMYANMAVFAFLLGIIRLASGLHKIP